MWTTPEKHTKKREILRNANQNKTKRRAGYKVEEDLARSSNKQYSENTDKWYLCKADSFSYSESLRTPPLEGTSLHR